MNPESFRNRSILVIGDVMLDHFVFGRVDRISPEAPVPVVAFDHEEYRLENGKWLISRRALTRLRVDTTPRFYECREPTSQR